jgi:iron complex outermembrane receptor protein
MRVILKVQNKIKLLSLIFVILPFLLNAQQLNKKSITGQVKDKNGETLIGVAVLVKSGSEATVTDIDGNFTLQAKEGDILIFRSISYSTKEVVVTPSSNYEVVLEDDVIALSDVVVVGYGTTKKQSLSSSVASLQPRDLNSGAITDVGRLLQGKVAGLNITASGDPNRPAAIVLRGASTINSPSGPFYVIDGVPGGDISLVAPADIASIDILKDAAATAIYGNRAAAGVIMVTTKKGRKGQTQVTYNGFAGVENVSSRLNLMDASQHRAYLASQGLSYNPIDDLGADTNWQDAVMRSSALSHNHNISFSGGNENSTYAASLNYVNKEGIMKGSSQERIIARLNLDQKAFNDKVKFSLNVANSQTNGNLVPLLNTVLEQVSNHLPVSPVFTENGAWFENYNIPGYFNPVALIDNAKHTNNLNSLLASFNTEVKLPFGLTYNLLLSQQKLTSKSQQYYNSYFGNYSASQFFTNPDPGLGGASLVGNLFGINGSAYKSIYERTQNNLETFVNWDKTFGAHNFNAVLGYSWINTISNDGIESSSTNFPSDFTGFNNFALGNPYGLSNFRINLAGGLEERLLISDFARVNYGYDDKYLIQASIRRDGGSVFGANYQWGYFPSVGAAWRITKEKFMANQNLLSDLKLRMSYGVTGNSEGISQYDAQLIYGITGTYYDNGKQENAYGPIKAPNPNLRWEKTATANIGLDFSFKKNVVSGSIDLYDKSTNDMIFNNVNLSRSLIPGGSILANGGSISNRGVEVLLNVMPVLTDNFSWTTTLNLAANKNEITNLSTEFSNSDSLLYTRPRGSGQTGATLQILKVGYPIGQFFSFDYEGKNAAGLSQFRKKDESITTVPLNGSDYFFLGNAQPKLLVGWSNSIMYKQFDFNVFFRGVFGNQIFNVTKANLFYTPNAATSNLSADLTAEDKVGDARNSFFSNRFIERGDYVRLDNATLGYTVSSKIKGINSLRFYLTGENLMTITGYSGIDPEINQGGIAPGVDNNNFFPKTRVMMFGINASF